MADKFGRAYRLEVQTESGGTLTVELPFTVEFDIIQNTLTSANICQIRIYNLSAKNRDQIRFNISDYGNLRLVRFSAGYGKKLVQIFAGNITQAWSVREKSDFITQIECLDGGFAFTNGVINRQYAAGTPLKSVFTDMLANGLPGIKPGAVGDYDGTLSRSNSFSGNTAQILSEMSGGGFFVNNGNGYVLKTNEYVEDGGTLLINSGSGLLGTPVLERTIVRFDMIFEPALKIGRKIKLSSLTEGNFNGDYKVTAVKHRGMISESVCGNAITTGEFFYNKILSGVSPIG